MVGKLVVVAILAVAIVVLAAFVATAQGAPSAPSAAISGKVIPSQGQSLQVTLYTQVNALLPPNSVPGLNSKFTYTAWQTNVNGGNTVLALNQQVYAQIVNQSGSLYTLGATVTFVTAAICTATACTGVTDNLTISVSAQVTTLGTTWFSPTSNVVFSNVAYYTSVPALTAPSPNPYYLELFVPLTLAIIFGTGIAMLVGVGRHPYAIAFEIILILVFLAELFLWA